LHDRQTAGEGRGMEGCAAVVTGGFCVSAGVEEGPGNVDIPDEGSKRDQRRAELGVDPLGVGPGRNRRRDAGGILGTDRDGQRRGGPS
jgi:hypothetical protein